MAKLLVILIIVGALSEGLAPSQPPLLIDAAPTAVEPSKPLDVTA